MKAIFNSNINDFELFDVGIRGENKVEVKDGFATFNCLKFSTTSYNNDVDNLIIRNFFIIFFY